VAGLLVSKNFARLPTTIDLSLDADERVSPSWQRDRTPSRQAEPDVQRLRCPDHVLSRALDQTLGLVPIASCVCKIGGADAGETTFTKHSRSTDPSSDSTAILHFTARDLSEHHTRLIAHHARSRTSARQWEAGIDRIGCSFTDRRVHSVVHLEARVS
jgi:hypothetical protein